MGPAHDHGDARVLDPLRVAIGPDGGGGGSRDAHQIGREDVVPVDLAQALGIDADLVPALGHHGRQQRQTQPKLLDEAVYVKPWSGGLDEDYAHADLAVARISVSDVW